MSQQTNFSQIDHNGHIHIDGNEIKDQKIGHKLLENLTISKTGVLQTYLGNNSNQSNKKSFIVEAYEHPLLVEKIEKSEDFITSNKWLLTMPYNHTTEVIFDAPTNTSQTNTSQTNTSQTNTGQTDNNASLYLDEWDRFHGFFNDTNSNSENHMPPFTLSKEAHFHFLNLVDEFDDDSITINGKLIATPEYFSKNSEKEPESFWTNCYKENDIGWDLGEASPILQDTLPQLKLIKSKILVLGCGIGHDAAYLANAGHLVTAVDFSELAIKQAKEKYGHITNIEFVCADIFDFLTTTDRKFGLVFEHTCYCAINPTLRDKLVTLWQRVLEDNGQLLGIFFVNPGRFGPPYGGSEWELTRRLEKNNFRKLYWTRCKNSLPSRLGKELIVFAQKKSGI